MNDLKSSAATRIFAVSLVLVVLAAVGFAVAYPVQLKLVSNIDSFNTTTIHCTDDSCSTFVDGTRQNINSGTNTNEYAVTGSGNITYTELDYASCQLPHVYRFAVTPSTTNGPFTVERNFTQKSDCSSAINNIELSDSSPSENSQVTITTSVHSAIEYPFESLSTITPPADLVDYYDTETQVVLNVRDANNNVVHTETKTAKPLMGKDDSVSFDYTVPANGEYTAEIVTQVTDCSCTSTTPSTSSATISVQDTSPVVDFVGAPLSGVEPLTVQFTDQTTSFDSISTWSWDFGDGETSTEQSPSHKYQNDGSYTVTLTVTDNDDSTANKQKTGYVNVGDKGVVVAQFTANPVSGTEPLTVSFDASLTNSNDGIQTYTWSFGDGSPSESTSQATIQHTYQQEGSYTVQLTATETDGDFGVENKANYISVTDLDPVPDFTFTTAVEEQAITFTSTSTSYDVINSYSWDFGDSGTETGSTVEHTYTTSGSYQVVLTVTEADGDSVSKTKTVDVSFVNDPPKIVNTPSLGATFDEDFVTQTTDLTQYESDEEDGPAADNNNLVWLVSGFDSSLITASIDQATDVLTINSVANAFGSTTVTLTLTDSDSLTATTQFTVTVNSVNDLPTTSIIPDQTWNEDFTQQIDLTQYFSDVEGFQGYSASNIQNIGVSIQNGVATLTPDQDFYGTRTVVFTATDTDGVPVDSNTITLTVLPQADITNSQLLGTTTVDDFSVIVDSTLTDAVVTNSRIERSTITNSTITNSNVTDSTVLDSTIEDSDIQNSFIDPTVLRRTTVKNSNITDSTFEDSTIESSDLDNAESTGTAINNGNINSGTVTINGENHGSGTSLDFAYDNAPTAQAISDISWPEDTTDASLDLDNVFSDVDGDTLAYLASTVDKINVSILNGVVTLTPELDFNGQRTVTFTAIDPFGKNATVNANLVVSSVNDLPQITSTATTSATEDVLYTYTVTATDVDNDALTFSFQTNPTGMIINSNTGEIEWTPTNDDVGTNQVSVKVDDGTGYVEQNFTVTVDNVNDAPTLDSEISVVPWPEDTNSSVNVSQFFSDVDVGDSLTFSVIQNPSNIAVEQNGDLFTFVPNQNFNGLDYVQFQASDGNGGTNISNLVTLNVTPSNDAPTINLIQPLGGEVWNVVQQIKWSASDIDGDTLLVDLFYSNDSGLTWNPIASGEENDGVFDWNTSVLSGQSFKVNITVSDLIVSASEASGGDFVLDNLAPLVAFVSPAEGNYTSSQTVNITASDNRLDTISLFVDGSVVTTSQSALLIYSLTDGNHTVYATANDTLGNEGQTEVRNIFIDSQKPTISFVSPTPVDGLFTNQNQTINVSATDDNLFSVGFSAQLSNGTFIGSGVATSSGETTKSYSLVLSDGNYTYHGTADDVLGNNEQTETRTLFIDTITPTLQFEDPTPADLTLVNSDQIINVSGSDTNLENISIFVDGSVVQTCSANTCSFDFNVSLYSNGLHTVNATITDIVGNQQTVGTRIVIDKELPSIQFENPTPLDLSSVSGISSINVSASDLSAFDVIIYIDGQNVTECSASLCEFSWDTTTEVDGSHYINATAVDSVGNQNWTETRTVTVDNTAPTISLVSPSDNDLSNIQNQNFIFEGNDNLASTLSCELYINNTLSGSNSSVSIGQNTTITSSVPEGSNSWYVQCSDPLGNTNQSGTRTLNTDYTLPDATYLSTGYFPLTGIVLGGYISPINSDGQYDSVSITVNTTEDVTFDSEAIQIVNSSGDVVNSFDGPGETSRSISRTWFGNDSSSNPLPDGEYTINITFTDLAGNIKTSTIGTVDGADLFVIDNTNPLVSLGGNQVVNEGDLVAFNGTNTNDGQGSGINTSTFLWDFGDGNTSTGQITNNTYSQNSTYTVTLNVTDNVGNTGTANITVTVNDLDPTSNFITPGATLYENTTNITFTDISTSSPDSIVERFWDFGDSTNATYLVPTDPTHIFESNGTYIVTLTVTDSDGSTNSSSTEVTVNDLSPNADFTWSPETQDEDQPVQFNDTSISVSDTIVNWSWDFGDGNTSTQQNPTHSYLNISGNFEVSLAVTDSDGSTNSTSKNITINPVNDAPFLSSSIPNITFNEDESNSSLDLSNYFTDIDNTTLEYLYSAEDANISVSFVGSDANITAVQDFFGTKNLTLIASDGEYLVNNTIVVTVNPVNDAPILATLVPDVSFDEDTFNDSLDLSSYFSDVDNSSLVYTADVVDNLTVNITGSQVNIRADQDFFGTMNVTFHASDGLLEVTDVIEITVNPVNDAPVLSAVPEVVFNEDGSNNSLDLNSLVLDVDNLDTEINWSVSGNTNVLFDINNTAKTINFSVTPDWNGQENLTLTATDLGGLNNSQSFTVTVNPVNDAPQIDSLTIENPSKFANGWYAGTVDLKANASDPVDPTGSIVNVTFEYSLDSSDGTDGNWTTISTDPTPNPFISPSWSIEPTSGTDELVWIRAIATDNENGQSEYVSKNLSVDNQVPVTSTNGFDNSTWYTSNITLNLTADDFSGSGVNATQYKINGNIVTRTVAANGQPNITTEGANNFVEFWSIDNLGQPEQLQNLSGIKLDKTDPVITNLVVSNNNVTEDSIGNYTINVTISDTVSGVNGFPTITYQIANENPVTENLTNLSSSDNYTFTISEPVETWDYFRNGNLTFTLDVVDNAGRVSSITVTDLIDGINDLPEVQITNPTTYGFYPNSGFNIYATATDTNDTQGNLTAAGFISNVTFEYSLDNSTWNFCNGVLVNNAPNFVHSCDGIINVGEEDSSIWLRVQSIDDDGEVSEYSIQQIAIDAKAPVTTDNIDQEWYNSTVTVDLNATDSGSGVNKTLWVIDDTNSLQPSTPYTGNFSFSDPGIWYLRYNSVDNTSNTESVKNTTIRIDLTLPQIFTVTLDDNYVQNGTVIGVTVNTTDALSGVSNVTANGISLDSQGDGVWAGNVTLTDANAFVTVVSTDFAGNSQTDTSATYTIDDIVPSISSFSITGDNNNVFSPNGDGNFDEITVNINASELIENWVSVRFMKDDNSSISKIFTLSLTDNSQSNIVIWDGSLSSGILEDGLYNITAKIEDPAGNLNESVFATITIDNTVPTIDLANSPADNTISSSILAINTTATDSHPQNISIIVNSSIVKTCSFTEECLYNLTDGNYTFYVTANDTVGNNATSETRSVLVDTIVPQISFGSAAPVNGSIVKGSIPSSPDTNFVLGSDQNFVNMTLYIDGVAKKTSIASPLTFSWDTVLFSDGLHYLNASVTDIAGNVNWTETREITIDNSNPQVDFNSPASGIYNSTQMVNITASDPHFDTLKLVNLSDGFVLNSTSLTELSFTLTDGNWSINGVANDTLGHLNATETRNILVDTIIPIINFESPTPANSSNLSGVQEINVSGSDVNLANISIFVNGLEQATCLISPCNFTWNTTALVDGDYVISASVVDLAGNANTTENRTVTIDNTNPSIQFVDPTPSDLSILGSNILINITASDPHLDTILFSINGSFVNTSSISPLTYLLTEGDHIVQAVVNDTLGNWNSTELRQIIIDTTAPLVLIEVNASQTFDEGLLVDFDGSNTTDNIVGVDLNSFFWHFSDDLNATGISTSRNFENGTYTVILNATDNVGNTGTANITVTVNDLAPTANFTSSPTTINENVTNVSFVDISTTPFDTITSWSWDFGDGENATTQNASHVFAVNGTYNVTLSVTDLDGSTNSYSQDVMVSDNEPSLTVTADPNLLDEGQETNLTVTAFSNPDSIISYEWDFSFDGDNFNVEYGPDLNSTVNRTFSQNGTQRVAVRVTDSDGSQKINTTVFEVNDLSSVLSMDIGVSTTTTFVNDTASYRVTQIDSNPDNITEYQWDFSYDGSNFNIENTTSANNIDHVFTSTGTFVVAARAVDSDSSLSNVVNISTLVKAQETHDLTLNSLTYDKNGSTVYLNDNVVVTANITNNGNFDENVTVKLRAKNGGTILADSQVVSISEGENKNVNLNWLANQTGLHNLEVELVPVSGETAVADNIQTIQSVRTVSVADNLNLSFVSSTSFPVPNGQGNEVDNPFFVWVQIDNLNGYNLNDLNISLDTNGLAITQNNQDGNTDTFKVLNLSAGQSTSFYWRVDAASGTYYINVTSGNTGDVVSTERQITIV